MRQVPKLNLEYYGDETRWFVGVVVDINDPLQLGRVKVRIYGIHTGNQSDISHFDLPWAQVVTPITEGGSSGIGANTGIKPMALVFGLFMDGKNSQMPIIIGSLPKFETSSSQSPPVAPVDDPIRPSNNSLVATTTLPAKEIDDKYLAKYGTENKERAYKFFLSNEGGSLQTHQSAGIVGNLIVESNVDPNALNEPEGSYGIAQWNPSANAGNRKGKLETFCADPSRNLPVDSLYAQLLFINYELFVVPENFGLKPLQSSKSAEEAAEVFAKSYEKPKTGTGTIKKRKETAKGLLEGFET